MIETQIDTIERQNAQALYEMQQHFQKMDAGFGIVSDIDETVVDTVGRHVMFVSRGAKLAGFQGTLPTLEEIKAAGGTAEYARVFGMSADEWEEIMKRVRERQFVNEKANLYHPKTVKTLLNGGELLGFVTAKPGTERTLAATQRDLTQRLGFPERPVILRPNSVPLSQTEWKIETLCAIKGISPKGIVLVDDSLSTARAIAAHNQEAGKLDIMQILYKGPLTVPALESGKFIPDESLGIYAADWDEMPEVFDRIREQCHLTQN
ncbi:hypothetical protein IPM65_04215 [Candidatus Roizmanbacteria bacterium]|nr:MAG: hypothetical protein IPM65_04215 [Candidatus Roizmanbacteria bacterium]